MAPAIRIWVRRIQPRRRPSSGSGNRSTSGAQKTFSRYGSATYELNPMRVLLAPESFSQACSALSVSWFGYPDEAASTRMANIFGLASTLRNDGFAVAVFSRAAEVELKCRSPVSGVRGRRSALAYI